MKFDSHIKHCTGQPGIICNFKVKNLVTFVDYIKYKGDIPLTAYIDFETNSPAESGLAPEDRSMSAISYVIFFAFYPYLNLDCVIIEKSFGHSLEKLTSLYCLTREQLLFHDKTTLLKLRNCAREINRRKKSAISNIFSTELKFASECLLKWFNKKHMKVELTNKEKLNYKILNPLNLEKDVLFVIFLLN